jgi:hypothetical protein
MVCLQLIAISKEVSTAALRLLPVTLDCVFAFETKTLSLVEIGVDRFDQFLEGLGGLIFFEERLGYLFEQLHQVCNTNFTFSPVFELIYWKRVALIDFP